MVSKQTHKMAERGTRGRRRPQLDHAHRGYKHQLHDCARLLLSIKHLLKRKVTSLIAGAFYPMLPLIRRQSRWKRRMEWQLMPLNLGSVRGRKSQANVRNKGLFHASDYSMQSQCMRLLKSFLYIHQTIHQWRLGVHVQSIRSQLILIHGSFSRHLLWLFKKALVIGACIKIRSIYSGIVITCVPGLRPLVDPLLTHYYLLKHQ